jgi:L-fuconolactonase
MATALIDTHLHLWDPAAVAIPWVHGNAILERRFAAAEFAAASAGCQVARAVFIQCDVGDGAAEVAWVVEQARIDPRIAAIVAHAPLEQGAAVRGRLRELATQPLVRGIRRLLQGEPAGFCARPEFVTGVQALAEFGFSFDLCLRRDQLAEATALVAACPQVRFMLDHLGNPPIASRGLDGWAEPLARLAALPNVSCKLSGIVTVAGEAWTIDDLVPYVDHAVRCFGAGRVAWGSDWPVVLLASDYRHWVDGARTLVASLPEADRDRILHDNAIAFYRLKP